jgi:hypothetical protein
MNKHSKNSANSLVRLFRFLFWYGAAVALLLHGLPLAGAYLQSGYESLSGTAKLIALAGFLAGIATWELRSRRDRLRSELDAPVVEAG